MKRSSILIILILATFCANGQGTLQLDQSVSPTNAPGGFANIQPDPTGQSFNPLLSSVGFVQFYLTDPTQVQGPTLFVNLWSGSLTNGTLLGQSDPVSLSTSSFGVITFFFHPISVTPGTTYYLQPVIQSGDSEEIGVVPGANYPNGTAFFSGTAQPAVDLWFREGIVVPEPSPFSLAMVGLSAIVPVLRRRNFNLRTHYKEPCSEEPPSRHFSPH
jgi:hypothetical protein